MKCTHSSITCCLVSRLHAVAPLTCLLLIGFLSFGTVYLPVGFTWMDFWIYVDKPAREKERIGYFKSVSYQRLFVLILTCLSCHSGCGNKETLFYLHKPGHLLPVVTDTIGFWGTFFCKLSLYCVALFCPSQINK